MLPRETHSRSRSAANFNRARLRKNRNFHQVPPDITILQRRGRFCERRIYKPGEEGEGDVRFSSLGKSVRFLCAPARRRKRFRRHGSRVARTVREATTTSLSLFLYLSIYLSISPSIFKRIAKRLLGITVERDRDDVLSFPLEFTHKLKLRIIRVLALTRFFRESARAERSAIVSSFIPLCT